MADVGAYQRKRARLTPKPSRLELAAGKVLGALAKAPAALGTLVSTAAAGATAVNEVKAIVDNPGAAIAAAAAAQAAPVKPKRKKRKKAKRKKAKRKKRAAVPAV